MVLRVGVWRPDLGTLWDDDWFPGVVGRIVVEDEL